MITKPYDPNNKKYFIDKVKLKNKIAIFSADFPPSNNAGAQRAYHLALALEQHYDVTIYTCKPENVRKDCKNIRIKQCPFKTPQNESSYTLRIIKELLFLLYCILQSRKYNGQIAIVFTPPFANIGLTWYLKKRNMLIFLDIRDLYPDVYIDSNLITKNSNIHKWISSIEKNAYKQCTEIITVCKSLAEILSQRTEKQINILPNGYDFPIPKSKEPYYIINNKAKLKCIIHGNFGKYQNINLINKITAKTEEYEILFIFAGFGSGYNKIEKRDNVHLLGQINRDEILLILNQCDIGLSFRTDTEIGRNAVPVKVLEYIGAGIPAITTPRSTDLGELEKTNCIKQFDSDQYDQIINFMIKATRNRKELEEMRESCLRNRHKYKRNNINKNYVDIIKKYIL